MRLSNLTSTSEAGKSPLKTDAPTVGSRLRKKESSSENNNIVVPRKFGSSFIQFMGGTGRPAAGSLSKDSAAKPDRPAIVNLPQTYYALDPDDSDDEAAGRLKE